MVTDLDCENKE